MEEHPIEGLMLTAMNSIRDMVDVNTIIGEPIETSNNIIIIPISKVGFGFASGGSEFNNETVEEYSKKDKDEKINYKLPFGGGSGAGVSISPVAFLVIQNDNVKLMPICHSSSLDKLLDYVPDLMEKVNTMLNKKICTKDENDKCKENKRNSYENKIENEIKTGKIIKESVDDNINENNNEKITIQNPNTIKVQPRRMQKYDFEYDNIEDEE